MGDSWLDPYISDFYYNAPQEVQNNIRYGGKPDRGFLGGLWDEVKGYGDELSWENLKGGAGILGSGLEELAFGTPKRGLDYLTSIAGQSLKAKLNPELGVDPFSQMRIEPGYEGRVSVPTIGEQATQPISQPFVKSLTRSAIDLGANPGVGALAIPGAGAAMIPSMAKGFGESAGDLWSEVDRGEGFTPALQEKLGGFLPTALLTGAMVKGAPASARELSPYIPEMDLGRGYTTRSPINLDPGGGGDFLPNLVSAFGERERQNPLQTLAEHGSPTRSWFDRGESPKPSPEGAYGAGLYTSQVPGEAPAFARTRSSALIEHPDIFTENVRGKQVPLEGNPITLKGDVSAEKPLYLEDSAPRDLRMQALIELNKAKNSGLIDPERADLFKLNILKPETTGHDLMYMAEELVKGNIPQEARATYTGDPYSEFIRSRDYDAWGVGKSGEPQRELVLTDPRRQFKVGETYDPREGSREVLADTSGEGVPVPERPFQDIINERLDLELTRNAFKNPAGERVTYTPEQQARFNEIETGYTGEAGPRPIELGKGLSDFARDLGYTDLPGGNLTSRMVEKSKDESAKPTLSPNADALKTILKGGKINKFTPKTIVDAFEKAGIPVPPEMQARIPELLGELEAAGWVNRKATGTYTFNQAPVRVSTPPPSPMGKELDLTGQLQASLEAPSKPVAPASDIEAIKGDILAKPVGTMRGEESLPVKPPTPPGEVVPPEEGGKPITYTVTLNDGSSHPVKAKTPEEAQAKAEEILSTFGSSKTVDSVEERLSSLERAAKEEIDSLKTGTEKTAEVKSSTGKEVGLREKAAEKEVKDVIKVEEGKLKASEKEATLREKAIEKELKEKIKIEEDFKKAQDLAKKKDLRKQTLEAKKKELEAKKKFKLENDANEHSLGWDLINLPKTLKSAIDISFPLRQGLFLLNRGSGLFAMKKGLASWKESAHLATKESLASRTNASLYKKFGLNQISYDPTTDVSAISEQFPSKLAEKIPGVKQSERIYNDQSNLMRADVFDEIAGKWRKIGKTPESHPELYAGLAKYLNVLTGRDPLPKSLVKAGEILNATFWSPQFVKSRLQILNPKFYWDLPGPVRTMALRDIGGTLGVLGATLGVVGAVAKSQGKDVEVESDPRHTNFGKLRVGDNLYDFFSGLLPIVRTAARIGTSKQFTPKGKYNLRGGFGRTDPNLEAAPFGRSAADEIAGFVEGKTSPVYQISKGVLSGQDYYGGSYGLDNLLEDLGMPMGLGDIQEGGLGGVPSLLGAGYSNTKTRERSRAAEGIVPKGSSKKHNLSW